MMKVALITTVGHNVGDDFVRDGICHLLRRAAGEFQLRLVHKHFPASARAGLHRWHLSVPGRWLLRVPGLRKPGRLARALDLLPLNPRDDAVLGCDLLVQSGAPVYWFNPSGASEDNEWYGPLIRRRWRAMQPRVPLLNLGAGACQPFDSDGSEFARAPRTLGFIREFFSECALTTVRDQLSEKILAQVGCAAPRLPCPSIFARQWHGVEPGPNDYVALNFMAKGGHYDLDGQADPERWRSAFGQILQALRRTNRCVLACHDDEEVALAKCWFPGEERFHATAAADYLAFYARASSGVLNRVHGAFALASFGRPAVIIGADSRARMGEELGLPVLSVSTAAANPGAVLAAHAKACADAGFTHRIAELARATEERYLKLLGDVVPRLCS